MSNRTNRPKGHFSLAQWQGRPQQRRGIRGMAVLARWCLHRRITVVLLWIAALAGLAAAATVAGSTYSKSYEAPHTESSHATALLRQAFPGQAGDSDTIVWHTDHGTVRAGAVTRTMTHVLDEARALPGVTSVTNPYEAARDAGISHDGRTAYATVTTAERRQHQQRPGAAAGGPAKAGQGPGLQVELGGEAVGNTESRHRAPERGASGSRPPAWCSPRPRLAFRDAAAHRRPPCSGSAPRTWAIVLLSHGMDVADFAPHAGDADRPRRRHRLRAVHRHPAPPRAPARPEPSRRRSRPSATTGTGRGRSRAARCASRCSAC